MLCWVSFLYPTYKKLSRTINSTFAVPLGYSQIGLLHLGIVQ